MDRRPPRLKSEHFQHFVRKQWRLALALVSVAIATGLSATRVAGQTADPKTFADFAFQDGDTVVFLGDSNTQWGSYVKHIENYTLFRFPERNIRFINAGLDGDMTSKAFFRLDRDVFSRGATAVVVLFGLNDISWGNYADSAMRQVFLDYLAKIVDSVRARGVRPYVLTYPLTAPPVGSKAADAFYRMAGTITRTDTSLLQKLGDEAMRVARAHGAETIDVQREMRRVVADLPAGTRLHQDDGGHLNEFGNQLLAFAILRGLGAPPLVSSVEIDAANLRTVKAEGATISDLRRSATAIEFMRIDRRLPLIIPQNAPESQLLTERVFAAINRYILKVTGLPLAARFHLRAGGLTLGPKCGFPGERLNRGIDLASLGSGSHVPKGPWAQQAIALEKITDAKAELESSLSYQALSELTSPQWRQTRSHISAALKSSTEAQKAIAKPVAYRFEVEQLTPAAIAACRQ